MSRYNSLKKSALGLFLKAEDEDKKLKAAAEALQKGTPSIKTFPSQKRSKTPRQRNECDSFVAALGASGSKRNSPKDATQSLSLTPPLDALAASERLQSQAIAGNPLVPGAKSRASVPFSPAGPSTYV
jgi:hypothetical protein